MFAKLQIGLFSYVLEQWFAADVLLHYVHVFLVDVSFVVFDYVWVVELLQHRDLVCDLAHFVVVDFVKVEHFDSDFHIRVVDVVRQKHFAKLSRSKQTHLFHICEVVVFKTLDPTEIVDQTE